MKLNEIQIRQRQAEFPRLLVEISYNNPIVHKIIEAYCYGQIVSKEEAYCQMIKALAVSYDEMMERIREEAHMKMNLGFYLEPKSK